MEPDPTLNDVLLELLDLADDMGEDERDQLTTLLDNLAGFVATGHKFPSKLPPVSFGRGSITMANIRVAAANFTARTNRAPTKLLLPRGVMAGCKELMGLAVQHGLLDEGLVLVGDWEAFESPT